MRLKFVVGSVLLAILMTAVPSVLHAQVRVGVAIAEAPPPLLVYDQPICPGDGYFWTPGYWDYDYDAGDYFWVPGTWVEPPEVGFLWTPGWWGWGGSGFIFNVGYWGPVVGFYGGINYGFGYFGTGFYGGRWEGGHFFYNTEVWHVGGDFHNVYHEHVDIRNDTHVAYNGHGGIDARPTREEEAAAHERHVGPVAAQTQHVQAARSDPQQRFSNNHGRPATLATARPGDFHGNNAVRGENNGARNEPNAARTENNAARTENSGSRTYTHPNDLPAAERPAAPNTGNAKQDQKIQQQQEKLYNKQQQERQKLQAQQDREHQQLQKQKASDARTQQLEQKHAQQTQQLQQRHTQQMQQMQQRSAPASHGGRPK